MKAEDPARVDISVDSPVWERFFMVTPLVVIGSSGAADQYDLAPKNMATPVGWDNYFGFVCTPSHTTYRNIVASKEFTVSFPRPDQIVLTSLGSAPRATDDTKPALSALPTVPARTIKGEFLKDSYVQLECRLDRIVPGFGENHLIVGRIVAAHIDAEALRSTDVDDGELLMKAPPIAYLAPGRYAIVDRTAAFPFPAGFSR